MLSMKTLRVAFAAAAAALLLGSGLASATVQHLDGTPALTTPPAPMPVAYAQERLGAGTIMTAVTNNPAHDMHKLVANLGERIEATNAEAYIHLRLHGGMQFSQSATGLKWAAGLSPAADYDCSYDANTGDDDDTLTEVSAGNVGYLNEDGEAVDVVHISGGAPGSTSVIFRIDASGIGTDSTVFGESGNATGIPATLSYDAADEDDVNNNSEACDRSGPTQLWVNVKDYLQIPSGTGAYGASLTLETRDTRTLGQATIVTSVNGINVQVKPGDAPAVANVGAGFLRFVGDRSTATLGTATAAMADPAVVGMLHNPDGTMVTDNDLLPDGSLSFTVKGDLSFGAFNLSSMANPCAGAGTPDAPSMGNLKPAEDDASMAMATLAAQNAGSYKLCVQVDTMGDRSNTTPIPAGDYTATITSVLSGRALDLTADQPIGRIIRNGATAHIAYLTTSEKQHQRVIVVNRGQQPIRITDYKFQSEDGTMVELTAAAMAAQEAGAVIGPGETMVRQVRDMINITGDSRRTALTMHFNAVAGNVSVATTQVNRENSSTDTVMWPVE